MPLTQQQQDQEWLTTGMRLAEIRPWQVIFLVDSARSRTAEDEKYVANQAMQWRALFGRQAKDGNGCWLAKAGAVFVKVFEASGS